MTAITIVGLGPGRVAQLTKEAEDELLAAEKIFFRTGAHPVHDWLKGLGKHVVCFDRLYTTPWKQPEDIYELMVSAVLKEAELHGSATYAVPGSPVFLEDTTRLLRQRAGTAGVQIKLVHGLSFMEEALAQLNLDFAEGLQVVLPRTHLATGRFSKRLALLVCQIEARRMPTDEERVDLTAEWLLRAYPSDHPVTLIWTDGYPEFETRTLVMKLENLVREYGQEKFYASLYVPPHEAVGDLA